MDHFTKFGGKKIDAMSQRELRRALSELLVEYAKVERAAKCFHEDVKSAVFRNGDLHTTIYTCRQCSTSWSDTK